MSEAHTPGPWQLFEVGDRIKRFAPANSDRLSLLTIVDEDGVDFACIESEADARLIAASPDLLEALQRAAQSAGFQYMTFETREAIDAALAKARESA